MAPMCANGLLSWPVLLDGAVIRSSLGLPRPPSDATYAKSVGVKFSQWRGQGTAVGNGESLGRAATAFSCGNISAPPLPDRPPPFPRPAYALQRGERTRTRGEEQRVACRRQKSARGGGKRCCYVADPPSSRALSFASATSAIVNISGERRHNARRIQHSLARRH